MKCRYILWFIVIIIIHLINWYFNMAFCGVYKNSNKGWLFGSLISVGIDYILLKPLLSTIKTLIRLLAKSYSNKYFF